jgi:diacylglycerol kinase family enzyme
MDAAAAPLRRDLQDPLQPARPHRLRPARLERIEIIANESSGSVGPGAAEKAEGIVRAFGIEARAVASRPEDLRQNLDAALGRAPDLLVVIAGDGTARAAGALAGPNGPLLAPLPGGTMNMLPRALYGERDWASALHAILTDGVIEDVGGGEIDGHAFHVAAILGNAALWANAREAIRARHLKEALARARYAWRRAFSTKLRFSLDGGPKRKAEALALMCPLVSRAMTGQTALEAVAFDPAGVGAVLRLGLHAVMAPLTGRGDWRGDPAVHTHQCTEAWAFARGHIPAVLDGEPCRLHKRVEIRFKPVAFRALVPAPASTEAPGQPPA